MNSAQCLKVVSVSERGDGGNRQSETAEQELRTGRAGRAILRVEDITQRAGRAILRVEDITQRREGEQVEQY